MDFVIQSNPSVKLTLPELNSEHITLNGLDACRLLIIRCEHNDQSYYNHTLYASSCSTPQGACHFVCAGLNPGLSTMGLYSVLSSTIGLSGSFSQQLLHFDAFPGPNTITLSYSHCACIYLYDTTIPLQAYCINTIMKDSLGFRCSQCCRLKPAMS